jgi:hypothetical protein
MNAICCCFKDDTLLNGASSSQHSGSSEVYMKDLVLHPSRIDAKLEGKIAEWQNAINDYQGFEDICMEEFEEDLRPILNSLKAKPTLFKNKNYSVNVQSLANKRLKVLDLQNKLETSHRDEDGGSCFTQFRYYFCFPCMQFCANRNRHTDPDSMQHDNISASQNFSMSEKLSAKWALRLNELNPTQGSLRASLTATSTNNNNAVTAGLG